MAKKSKLIKTINWILNILIVVFLIGTIYMVLWKVFGNSPTDFQVISWAVGLLSMVILKLFAFTYDINREIGELGIGVKNGFRRIKEDMEGIKNKLSS